MASGGYPNHYDTGFEIAGLDEDGSNTPVFTAGVGAGQGGVPVTSGGRVLTVVGGGDSIAEAREQAYRRLETIRFEGACWRTDIGLNA